MKLLHTSDWHVGRTIRGRSRAGEHRAVLAEIVAIAEREEVDVVLVAGDQFDVAAPSAEAEQVVYRALLDLAATGAEVVVLAGNHDNPRRWNAVRPLLDLTNVHLASTVRRPDDGGVVDVRTRDGETLRLAMLPWLSQRGIVTADVLMATDAAHQQQAFADRMRRVVASLSDGFAADTVNVVLGHVTCVASSAALSPEGERRAHLLDYAVPPTVFTPETQYVALGHLHRAHKVTGPAPIHYCGAPLSLDFGEARTELGAATHKSVNLVEVTAGVPAAVRAEPLTAGTPLRTLRGTAEQVREQVGTADDVHLRIVLEEPPRVGLGQTLRALFPTAVDVLLAPPENEERDERETWELERFRGDPVELFSTFLQEVGAPDDALVARFRTLLDRHHAGERSDEAPTATMPATAMPATAVPITAVPITAVGS